MTTHLTVYAVEPNESDAAIISDWSVAHLAEVENWAARRGVAIPADVIGDARGRYAGLADASGFRPPRHSLPELGGRPRLPASSSAHSEFLQRLGSDLSMYGASLKAGGVYDLTVTIIDGIASTCYHVPDRWLFMPRWLFGTVPGELFRPNATFPAAVPVTLSWLFFQALTLTAVGELSVTVATTLNVRESD